jgi:hypothetical protein
MHGLTEQFDLALQGGALTGHAAADMRDTIINQMNNCHMP